MRKNHPHNEGSLVSNVSNGISTMNTFLSTTGTYHVHNTSSDRNVAHHHNDSVEVIEMNASGSLASSRSECSSIHILCANSNDSSQHDMEDDGERYHNHSFLAPLVNSSEANDNSDLAHIIEANIVYKENLRSSAFYRWKERTDQHSSQQKYKELFAKSLYDNKTRYTFFRAWQWRYEQRVNRRKHEETVERFFTLRVLLPNVFRRWKNSAEERINVNYQVVKMNYICERKLFQYYFSSWKSVASQQAKCRACKGKNNEILMKSYYNRLLSQCFLAKRNQLVVRTVQCHTPYSWWNDRTEVTNGLLLNDAWRRWLYFTYEKKSTRIITRENHARQLVSQNATQLLQRHFNRWLVGHRAELLRKQTDHAVQKTYFTDKWLNTFHKDIRMAKEFYINIILPRDTKQCFREWRSRLSYRLTSRQMAATADAFFENRTKKVFYLHLCFVDIWKKRFEYALNNRKRLESAKLNRSELLSYLMVNRVTDFALRPSAVDTSVASDNIQKTQEANVDEPDNSAADTDTPSSSHSPVVKLDQSTQTEIQPTVEAPTANRTAVTQTVLKRRDTGCQTNALAASVGDTEGSSVAGGSGVLCSTTTPTTRASPCQCYRRPDESYFASQMVWALVNFMFWSMHSLANVTQSHRNSQTSASEEAAAESLMCTVKDSHRDETPNEEEVNHSSVSENESAVQSDSTYPYPMDQDTYVKEEGKRLIGEYTARKTLRDFEEAELSTTENELRLLQVLERPGAAGQHAERVKALQIRKGYLENRKLEYEECRRRLEEFAAALELRYGNRPSARA
ncbi:hypothetical protein ADEAN_000661500 [Angomonas deanei]|uniref:Sfi1 spindle body protein n=1 Tax=Angomonas deanei TaxID=59799 RepID=A0A7G2CLI7_9TRYP|nr:hypothetical protein ADEAN_000661500 [Angomonas deanei]